MAEQVRTQIYLPRPLHRALRRAAKERGVSMAELIREAAEEVVRRSAWSEDPLSGLIGAAPKGPDDIAENHDRYLVDERKSR